MNDPNNQNPVSVNPMGSDPATPQVGVPQNVTTQPSQPTDMGTNQAPVMTTSDPTAVSQTPPTPEPVAPVVEPTAQTMATPSQPVSEAPTVVAEDVPPMTVPTDDTNQGGMPPMTPPATV